MNVNLLVSMTSLRTRDECSRQFCYEMLYNKCFIQSEKPRSDHRPLMPHKVRLARQTVIKKCTPGKMNEK